MKIDMDKVQKWEGELERIMGEIDKYTDKIQNEMEKQSQSFCESSEGLMVQSSIEELDIVVDGIMDILDHIRQVSA